MSKNTGSLEGIHTLVTASARLAAKRVGSRATGELGDHGHQQMGARRQAHGHQEEGHVTCRGGRGTCCAAERAPLPGTRRGLARHAARRVAARRAGPSPTGQRRLAAGCQLASLRCPAPAVAPPPATLECVATRRDIQCTAVLAVVQTAASLGADVNGGAIARPGLAMQRSIARRLIKRRRAGPAVGSAEQQWNSA